MEGRLRDLLLDLEDRVHQGTLGSLKVTKAVAAAGEMKVRALLTCLAPFRCWTGRCGARRWKRETTSYWALTAERV